MATSPPANAAFAKGLENHNENRRPASMQSWGLTQAQHLLMRAAFGASPQETAAAASQAKSQVIETLLADAPLPEPPGDWVTEGYNMRGLSNDEKKALRRLNRERYRELLGWWIALMQQGPDNLREKMVFFWHGHFVVETAAVKVSQFLYQYLDMLRRHALGNFRDFLREMWKSPAMLIYLNGNQNSAAKPNENFARELMELFTMGVDQYTEQDIKESARAFTGWRIDTTQLRSSFVPRRHDYGAKTFLGRKGNFDGDDIIDIILEQPATAKFICSKFYRFFVSPEIDDERVEALASTFRDGDYEIKPVLRQLFNSDYFYDEQAVGALIKTPFHLVVSLPRQFGAQYADLEYLYRVSEALDQVLLNPPNVAGWPGQRAWISPLLLATRGFYGETAIMGGRLDRRRYNPRQKPIGIDAMAFARDFGIDTPRELLQAWIEHLLPLDVDAVSKDFLLSVLLEGADEADWSLGYPGVEERIKNCLVQILKLPEYQLT